MLISDTIPHKTVLRWFVWSSTLLLPTPTIGSAKVVTKVVQPMRNRELRGKTTRPNSENYQRGNPRERDSSRRRSSVVGRVRLFLREEECERRATLRDTTEARRCAVTECRVWSARRPEARHTGLLDCGISVPAPCRDVFRSGPGRRLGTWQHPAPPPRARLRASWRQGGREPVSVSVVVAIFYVDSSRPGLAVGSDWRWWR